MVDYAAANALIEKIFDLLDDTPELQPIAEHRDEVASIALALILAVFNTMNDAGFREYAGDLIIGKIPDLLRVARFDPRAIVH